MNAAALRKQAVETLGLLVERYPNIPIGIILDSSVGSIYHASDADLARGLNQLFVSYTQFEAAGIKP